MMRWARLPQARQGLALLLQGLGGGLLVRQGMGAPGLAEPPDQRLFGRLQEDEVQADSPPVPGGERPARNFAESPGSARP